MLGKPQYGWTEITIGDYQDRAGFLTDVPFDFLDAMIASYKRRNTPFCVRCDAEGFEYSIVCNEGCDCQINIKSRPPILIQGVCKRELAKEIIDDIESSIDDWATWRDTESVVIEARKKMLGELTKELRKIIKY